MTAFDEVKLDCFHFKGAIPCKPNKLYGVSCMNCSHYEKISTRILIIKLGALGDVIRSTPLLEPLRHKFPNAHITWLTLNPSILPPDKIDEILPLNFINLYNIENSTFDVAINLDKDKEACILLNKLSASEKYGYTWINNHIAPATKNAEHKLLTGFFDDLSKSNTKNYIQEIFEICHFEFNGEDYQINLNEKLSSSWNEKLLSLSEGKKIVGLNTGCGPRWNTRLWKDEYWIETASQLRNKGYFPIFLGGELEHEKNQRLSEQANVYYPGHFSLEEFIALTNCCETIITQVTMMMHIATALRKKMVLMNTIFNPHEFELYGRGVIIGPEKGCDCYFGNSCIHNEPCMLLITPESVVQAINNLSV
jgi:ADP-heptose:LPS heptosyltransferase